MKKLIIIFLGATVSFNAGNDKEVKPLLIAYQTLQESYKRQKNILDLEEQTFLKTNRKSTIINSSIVGLGFATIFSGAIGSLWINNYNLFVAVMVPSVLTGTTLTVIGAIRVASRSNKKDTIIKAQRDLEVGIQFVEKERITLNFPNK